MSSTPTRNIALTQELERYIRDQVASGHYANASEVVRAGLRLLIERDHKVPRTRRTPPAASAASADVT